MIIQEILAQLENTVNPIVKILQRGDQFKVIAMGFKKGMILKEHKTPIPAKLVVIDGNVLYRQGEESIALNKFDEHEIPVNIIHSVEALHDSICILIQG
ncbi:MAG: hypothetical protein ABI472_24490 [Ginsengibacter sp.]